MSIRKIVTKALSIVTDTGTKAVTGVVKDVSGTAKDVTGIRKDLVETKVAQIKVEEYESQIQRATLGDVKKYDQKIRDLEYLIAEIEKIRSFSCDPSERGRLDSQIADLENQIADLQKLSLSLEIGSFPPSDGRGEIDP
jgi:predicted  nucleic acid-binding Zn-ribbon protein